MRDWKDPPRRPRSCSQDEPAAPAPAWVQQLGELEPPAHARARVLDAMRAAARAGAPARAARRWRTVGLAAGVAIAALGAAWLAQLGPQGGGASDDSAAVAGPAILSPEEAATRADLLEASRQLENVLAALPAQRRLMRAGTATTIAALETQIAVIDERLLFGTSAGLAPEVERTLWRERVDALNALVQVRYAQSRFFEY